MGQSSACVCTNRVFVPGFMQAHRSPQKVCDENKGGGGGEVEEEEEKKKKTMGT